jgi:UPF0271 protein
MMVPIGTRVRGHELKEAVDINCDMGEAFGRWRIGDAVDEELIPLISSANIATGFHAGDPNLMDETVRIAAAHGVGVGAHPGYRDLQGFGRRKINGTSREIVNDLIYQVGALREFARRHDVPVQHVKPHGALYMELAANADLSQLFIQYMRTAAPNMFVFCMDRSATCLAAQEAGQPIVREFYADRDYGDTGWIVFTRDAGRPDIPIAFDSICFHSDTLGALEIVRHIREALVAEGIRIAPVSQILNNDAARRSHEQA